MAIISESPAPRGNAGAGLGDGSCEAAVSSTELITDRLIEERLKTCFGLSPERARAIASLAQLGSREARHG